MPADTLTSIAQRAAGRHVHGIEGFGDLPWELIAPIIAKVKSPEQLHRIELSTPQTIGHTSHLWIALMHQDIPRFTTAKPHRPSCPENWYKVYKKLKRQADAETAASAEKLKAAFESIKTEKEQNLAKLTTKVVMPARRVNGGGGGSWGGRGGGWGPSTKNLSASERIKRQVNDSAKARLLRERNQVRLNGQLKQSAYKNPTKVTAAPRYMVEEIKARNASPPPLSPAVRAPARRGGQGSSTASQERRRPQEAGAGYDLVQDREARLKALQSKKPVAQTEASSSSHAEPADPGGLSLDFLEDDELFSEEEPDEDKDELAPPPRKAASPHKPTAMTSISAHPARPASPIPRPAMGVKRKAPPTLFMSSPAKKVRSKVS